jgi:Fe-S-cluster containining protein
VSASPSTVEGAEEAEGPLADASALCLGCGLCCNGVMFSQVRAEQLEAPKLRELGLDLERIGDRLKFRLPCPLHHDGQCGIYSDRPRRCRTFRCALLKRLDSGETTLAEAQATVGQGRKMLARVTDLDPASAHFAERDRQRAAPLAGDGKGAALRRRVMIESLALDLFLDRKFRNRKAVEMESSRPKAKGEEG